MKIGVLGPGAIGCLFGGYLALAGHEVWLVGRRPDQAEAIRERGIRVLEPSGERRSCHAAGVTTDPATAGACDLVLVAVKAYDTEGASRSLPPLLGPGTPVLSLQNGLGNAEVLGRAVPQGDLFLGVTGQGANTLGAGEVHHAGSGETCLGAMDGRSSARLERLAETLCSAGLVARTTSEIRGLLWGKLLVNVAINPLTAILRARNGALLELPGASEVMRAAALEAAAVAAGVGVRLPYDDPWARVQEVARHTAANRSSMLQDVERGRRTEIEAINGAVMREGQRLGVPTPVNATLYHLVKAVEAKDAGPYRE